MTRTEPKGQLYATLFARLTKSIHEGYYLEGSWLIYAAIEDRVLSMMRQAKIAPKGMLSQKVNLLETHRNNDLLLTAQLSQDLLDRLNAWIALRNALMHDVAKYARPWEDIEADSLKVATDGEVIVRELAATAMRYKRDKKVK